MDHFLNYKAEIIKFLERNNRISSQKWHEQRDNTQEALIINGKKINYMSSKLKSFIHQTTLKKKRPTWRKIHNAYI